ncbi:MAG: glutamyl-tRNA reductase [Planctomycetota bacterium]
MRVLLLGVNYRTASLSLRESLAIGKDRLPEVLAAFRRQFPESAECVLLSTCNRTELYVARPTHAEPSVDAMRAFLAEQTGADLAELTAISIHREQHPAVHHLFRVTAGLDAMAVGESQVLGQVRRAYDAARAAGTAGPALHRVFQSALKDARQAHRLSGADTLRQSVSTIAVSFAGNLFESLDDKTVVGLGAGDVTRSALQRMQEAKPGKTWVVNRTPEAGARLADELNLHHAGGGARPWEDLDEVLVEADIVLTGTSAQTPVITADRFRSLVKKRRNRPLFLIDLAVPRDVEPEVGALPNVYLFNLDDLNAAMAEAPENRDKIEHCEALVRAAADRCIGAAQHQDLGVLVRQLRGKLQGIADHERDRTVRRMRHLHETQQYDRIESLLDEHTHRLINKLLHTPLSQMNAPRRGQGPQDPISREAQTHSAPPEASMGFYAAALRRLFDLQDLPATPTRVTPTVNTEPQDAPTTKPSARQPAEALTAA